MLFACTSDVVEKENTIIKKEATPRKGVTKITFQKTNLKNNSIIKMRNIFLTLFFISSIVFSQGQKSGATARKNEFKTNLVLPIVQDKISIIYERVLHKNHSVGIDAFYNYRFFDPNYKATNFIFLDIKYGFRIFYKRYVFNKKYAEGFFLKPMVGIVHAVDDDTTDFDGNPVTPINEIRKSAGFFLGYEFNFSKHFLLELQVDLIQLYYGLFIDPIDDLPPKSASMHDIFGVFLGYRF